MEVEPQNATLSFDHQSAIIASKKKKPGRPKMAPYGNKSRRAQKGIYLSADTREMLGQAAIVLGVSDSAFAEEAIRERFMKKYLEHKQAYGEDFWKQSLDRAHYIDRLKLK